MDDIPTIWQSNCSRIQSDLRITQSGTKQYQSKQKITSLLLRLKALLSTHGKSLDDNVTNINISPLKIIVYGQQSSPQMTHGAWPFLLTLRTKWPTNYLDNSRAKQLASLHKSGLLPQLFISVHQSPFCTVASVNEYTTIPTAPS